MVSELCGLTLDRVHLTPEDAYITVLGKGKKERELGLGQQARAALHRYISRYRQAPPGDRHVFINRYHQHFQVNGLEALFNRLRDVSGIVGVRCSPHTCRHSFAIHYLQAGGDVYRLSRLLGHTSIKTTEHYLRAYQAQEARRDGLSVLDKVF